MRTISSWTGMLLSTVSAVSFIGAQPLQAQEVIDNDELVSVPGTQGSPWHIPGNLIVGGVSTGGLEIPSGGAVSNTAALIGYGATSSGKVSVSGPGSQWNNLGRLIVGSSGNGQLSVSDGGVVSNTVAAIGAEAGSTGTVTVNGSGSQWNNSRNLYVGGFSNGALTVENGGSVSNVDAMIGTFAGSTGKVSVSGPGSQWNNLGRLIVGSSGNGLLSVSDGGVVSNTVAAIGAEAGSTGTVTVNGSGSQWNNSRNLYVGGFSNGALTVENSGSVSNVGAMIGTFAGSTGKVSVSGPGSQWNNSDILVVGFDGTGSLGVSDKGQVQAPAIELARNTGSIGIISIGTGGAAGALKTSAVKGGAGEATVNFNHSDDNAFVPLLTGNLDVNKVNIGTTTLIAANDYTGLTTINDGSLRSGGLNVLSSNSGHLVNASGTLDLNGFSQTIASLQNAGMVSIAGDPEIVAPGAVLTVTGNYRGNGGTMLFNTVLEGDGSVTDKLVVGNGTVGLTSVKVKNIGGSGAQTVEGIKVIEVAGASEGAFTLLGDYETLDNKQATKAGAYAYTLEQYGLSTPEDGDWYLRSTLANEPGEPDQPRFQAATPVYEAYPQALLALNGVSSLKQRVGNRVWADNGNKVIAEGADTIGTPYAAPDEAGVHTDGNGVWGRIEGAHNHIETERSSTGVDYDQTIFKLQAGVDGMLMENENGKLIGGVSVNYAHGFTKTISIYDAMAGGGQISTDGYGLGGTLTWYSENGLYVDAQAQATWYNSDLSYAGGNQFLIDGHEGNGYALSIEGGKRIALDPTWSVTPQAQLVYSNVDFDDFHDVDNIAVRLGKSDSLQGRLGITLDHQTAWQNASGMLDRTHVYGIANLYYEFLEGTRVDVVDVSFANRKDRTWGGSGWADPTIGTTTGIRFMGKAS